MSTASFSHTHPEASSRRIGDSAAGSAWVPSTDVSCCQHNDEMEDDSDDCMDDASDIVTRSYRLTAAQRKYHASIVAWTTKMWCAVRIVMEQRRRMGIDATYTSRCWAPSDRSAALSERQQFMAGFAFPAIVAAMPSLPDSDTASVESKSSAGDADGNGNGSGNEDGQAQ